MKKLEELSNRLDDWIVSIAAIACLGITEDSVRIVKDIRTAQRIIAELAKVQDVDDFGGLIKRPEDEASVVAIVNCRAIAEEGKVK